MGELRDLPPYGDAVRRLIGLGACTVLVDRLRDVSSSLVCHIGAEIYPRLEVWVGDQQCGRGVVADIAFRIRFEQSERNGVLNHAFNNSLCDVLSDRGRDLLVRSGALQRYKVLDAVILNDLKRSGGAMLN